MQGREEPAASRSVRTRLARRPGRATLGSTEGTAATVGKKCGRKGDGMKDLISVCVYCGSSSRVSDTFKDAAHRLGTLLGGQGHRLVYGGGRVGLMGIVADA